MASRKFKGVFPDNVIKLINKDDWFLFLTNKTDKWKNIKLVKNGFDDNKANYYLSWDGERFSNNKDYEHLKEYRNDLLVGFVIPNLVLL